MEQRFSESQLLNLEQKLVFDFMRYILNRTVPVDLCITEHRDDPTENWNACCRYMIEIQRLEEERKSLKAEKERLGETFEMKLRRAQSLYETELTAAKMLYSKELEALRDHEEALKEELLAR